MSQRRASCLRPRTITRTFTTSSARSLTRVRIRSAEPCCSSILIVMVTTACAGITCAGNLTCRLVATSARISHRTSFITLLKKRRTRSFIASPMKSVWNWQASIRWFTATRHTRRCLRRRTLPPITLTASALPSRRAWRRWRKSWSAKEFRC